MCNPGIHDSSSKQCGKVIIKNIPGEVSSNLSPRLFHNYVIQFRVCQQRIRYGLRGSRTEFEPAQVTQFAMQRILEVVVNPAHIHGKVTKRRKVKYRSVAHIEHCPRDY